MKTIESIRFAMMETRSNKLNIVLRKHEVNNNYIKQYKTKYQVCLQRT